VTTTVVRRIHASPRGIERGIRPGRRHVRLAVVAGLIALVSASLRAGATVTAHGPNPLLGTSTWYQDQSVGYQWRAGAVPPSWMAAAIDAGAADVGASMKSRAATFVRRGTASSPIAYGGLVPCSSYGIACIDRTGVPDSFTGMWFRPHGWAFDWGPLRWCQALSSPSNGCYDAENVALDEFGHIEILGHHVNYDDESDFTDSVVQFAARARPKAGWNQHAFGRCDVARLQLEYELENASRPVSTCLALATSLSILADDTAVRSGEAVRISGNLKVAVASAARKLSGDPLSDRGIVLQRRSPGGTAWTTIGTLAANPSAGSYGLTIYPTQTYDYRLVYSATTTEGLLASTSGAVRITTGTCSAFAGRNRTPYAACI